MFDINTFGSHKIHIIIAGNQTIQDLELDFNNIVFAGNGEFIVKHNELFTTCIKTEVPYVNIKLPELNDYYNFTLHVTPPSPEIYSEIIEIGKYVNSKSNYEVLVDLYYNKTTEKYELDISEDQKINHVNANIDYKNSKYEFNENYIKYLQLHSHNTMSAKFSSTDNQDEIHDSKFCIFGVIGKLNSESSVYSTDSSFRIYSGVDFINLNYTDVFDFKSFNHELHINKIKLLDKIIEKSRILITIPTQLSSNYLTPSYLTPSYLTNPYELQKLG